MTAEPDHALQRSLANLTGPFAGFTKSEPSAPNPALRLHGATYGLPLAAREQPALLASTTRLGPSIHEIPRQHVAVGNSRWGGWLNTAGVDSVRSWMGARSVRAVLSRAVVFTQGSAEISEL